jgi:hypothetical protein
MGVVIMQFSLESSHLLIFGPNNRNTPISSIESLIRLQTDCNFNVLSTYYAWFKGDTSYRGISNLSQAMQKTTKKFTTE